MKFAVILVFSVVVCCCHSKEEYTETLAKSCDEKNCELPKCSCYGSEPLIEPSQKPQIVLISTDDSITEANYKSLYEPLYEKRKNPNGCPIGATFFVPHDSTNYNTVHELYAHGFEIGVNSITKNYSIEYWNTASKETLIDEFEGQKKILAKFAKIDEQNIRGARTPLLQIHGDTTFSAYEQSGLAYDNSWTTRDENDWPYTLDYASNQECFIGECPKEEHKGFWVLPINDWTDEYGVPCATIQGCAVKPTSLEGILEWLKSNFHQVYDNKKTPFNIVINAGVFGGYFQIAFAKFLDYIQSKKDVYIVNQNAAIEWFKNPLPISNINIFPCNPKFAHDADKARKCELNKGEEKRYMEIYNEDCPKVFPWIGNPAGL